MARREHGKYSSHIALLTTSANSQYPRRDYAKKYITRLAFYADAAAKHFKFTLRELGEFAPDTPQVQGEFMGGFAAHSGDGSRVQLLMRVDPPHEASHFYAEPHLLLVLAHKLAHVIVEQKIKKFPVVELMIRDHGYAHLFTFLEVWKFLLKIMKEYHIAGHRRMGEVWTPVMYGPAKAFGKLPRRMWEDHTVDMSPWRKYAWHRGRNGKWLAAPSHVYAKG